ncbi:MAG: DUF2007 domain-containing protein [Gemmatimonadota bacterium]
MVVIRSYANEFEAEFAKAELAAADIPVQLLTDGLGGVHPHLQFARGIRLAVPESEAEAARDLLGPADETA